MRKIIFDFSEIKQEDLSIEDNNKVQAVDKKDEVQDMFEYINGIMEDENYGIGLHSTQGENSADSIMKTGLEIQESKKILSTVSSFGSHTKISQEHLKKQMMEYSYSKQGETNERFNIVVLVPTTISNSQGKQIYLGFPPYDIECHGNDFRTSCVLDTICSGEEDKGTIPPEFIVGYYTNGKDGVKFVKNPKYFKFLSKEQKDELFENMKGKLQGKYKKISDAVISEDLQTLEEMSKKEQDEIKEKIENGTRSNILERGLNRELAEKLSRDKVQIRQDDSATRALVYLERKRDQEQQVIPRNENKKRRILLDSYQDVKLSDLKGAKETLREGIETPEKINEGKEV